MGLKRLVALLLVFVMVGSVVSPVMATSVPVSREKVHKVEIKVVVKKKSKTLTVVQVNNVLITLKSNKDLTQGRLEIKDLKTGKRYIYKYTVSKMGKKFITNVYCNGKFINRYESKYNPLDPAATKNILVRNKEKEVTYSRNLLVGVFSYSYWWDGVKFVKGYGVKYPHPDYTYYKIEPWETCYISGNQLIHYHINEYTSNSLSHVAPAALFAAIGAMIGGPYGAAVGAALGIVSGNVVLSVLVDEHNCIWFWYAKSWEFKWLPEYPFLYYVPKYIRIATWTAWDDLGIGNP